MIFWILFALLVTFVWAVGSTSGYAVGYRRGVRETVQLNDAAYRAKLSAETESARIQNENYTAEIKKRMTHQMEELKSLGIPIIGAANLHSEETTQVKTESGNVIEFPNNVPSTDRPA